MSKVSWIPAWLVGGWGTPGCTARAGGWLRVRVAEMYTLKPRGWRGDRDGGREKGGERDGGREAGVGALREAGPRRAAVLGGGPPARRP
jgi:hypothetical protein